MASNIFDFASVFESSWANPRCSLIVYSAVFWLASATALTTDECVYLDAGRVTTVGIALDYVVTVDVVVLRGAGVSTTTDFSIGPGTGTYLVTGTTLSST